MEIALAILNGVVLTVLSRGASTPVATTASATMALAIASWVSSAKTAAWVLTTANVQMHAQAMAPALLLSESSCLMRCPMSTETASYLEVSDASAMRAGRALTVHYGLVPTSARAMEHARRMEHATATRTGLARIVRPLGARTSAVCMARVSEVEVAFATWAMME